MSEEYLRNILSNYQIDAVGAERAGNTLVPIIKKWAGKWLANMEFSGSLAKGTAVNIGTDADIFISLSSGVSTTLAQIYHSLYKTLIQHGYVVRGQNVSIGLEVNGYKIDLVPGRRQDQFSNDHSLYKNKTGTWTQTNVNTHISYVKKSNRIDEIKLTKIWTKLHNLTFPSFYLEMAVIDSLKNLSTNNLVGNFLTVLEFLRDRLLIDRYVDPSNSANVISDDLTPSEKLAVSDQASFSRNQQSWYNIVW